MCSRQAGILWQRLAYSNGRPRTKGFTVAHSNSSSRGQSFPSSSNAGVGIWPGLSAWRNAPVDEGTWWREREPSYLGISPESESPQATEYVDKRRAVAKDIEAMSFSSLAEYGQQVLHTSCPVTKACLSHKAWREFSESNFPIGKSQAPDIPSRPAKPELVPARRIPKMKESDLPPSAYMLHNLAHVELNAIDLAWDTVVRFSDLEFPERFYADFARVADDESRHLCWCLQRLAELGYKYGDMPAHNLLWEGCIASASDVRERLAVVPMSQEARGLDAGGRLAERLVGMGDNVSAAIVSRIAEEEQAHVAVGVFWFRAICEVQGEDSRTLFLNTLADLCPDLLKGPFNHTARQGVGLPHDWYDETVWDEGIRHKMEDARQRRKSSAAIVRSSRSPLASHELDLAKVRDRLSSMLEMEVAMS